MRAIPVAAAFADLAHTDLRLVRVFDTPVEHLSPRAGPLGAKDAAVGLKAKLEAAGIQNVLTKSLGSANSHNVVRATFTGLRDSMVKEGAEQCDDGNRVSGDGCCEAIGPLEDHRHRAPRGGCAHRSDGCPPR